MEISSQEGYSMESWSTFIFKSIELYNSEENVRHFICAKNSSAA